MQGVPEKFERVHPILEYRARLLLDDPALGGEYGLVSGWRSREKQIDLWERYQAGTFPNLVANPYRELGTGPNFPYDWTPRGSWHMDQEDGYAHALDLARPWHHSRAEARALVHPLLPKYGLVAPVSSEWWHVQALTSSGWVDGPLPDEPDEEDDMITCFDTTTEEAWVCANGKARPISNDLAWVEEFDGPIRRHKNMRYVIENLYEVVEVGD